MSTLILDSSDDALGELLRSVAFVGNGYGCYSTFDVRDDARRWSEDRMRGFWEAYFIREEPPIDDEDLEWIKEEANWPQKAATGTRSPLTA
jgi:hypothetical protein